VPDTPDIPKTPNETTPMAETKDPMRGRGLAPAPSVLILSVISAFLLAWIIFKSIDKPAPEKGPSLAEKQAELDTRLANANRKRQELGQAPLLGFGLDDAEKIASRLTRDAVQLASFADGFRLELTKINQLLEQRSEELLASEQTRSALTSQLAKLQMDLDASRQQSSSGDELRIRLEQAESRLAPLREELAKYSSRPSIEEWNTAKARILDLESQLASIQLAPSSPVTPSSKLFAESEADLMPHAQSLFRELSTLEEKPDQEISAAYSRFATQLKASFLNEVRFEAGSSTLKPSDKMAIKASLANLPKGAMILVVGYSSNTGDADSNRLLSSNRAIEVATNINIEKQEKTAVQAVFFGQTKRFSPIVPERNQVCEVWAILP
jgi:outer membrane protein OmpA-like peptidoglycan-associated protein